MRRGQTEVTSIALTPGQTRCWFPRAAELGGGPRSGFAGRGAGLHQTRRENANQERAPRDPGELRPSFLSVWPLVDSASTCRRSSRAGAFSFARETRGLAEAPAPWPGSAAADIQWFGWSLTMTPSSISITRRQKDLISRGSWLTNKIVTPRSESSCILLKQRA